MVTHGRPGSSADGKLSGEFGKSARLTFAAFGFDFFQQEVPPFMVYTTIVVMCGVGVYLTAKLANLLSLLLRRLLQHAAVLPNDEMLEPALHVLKTGELPSEPGAISKASKASNAIKAAYKQPKMWAAQKED